MGTDGGLVTARIESPLPDAKKRAINIDSVIDAIRNSRLRIERW